jgi:hypothetical protein
MTTVRHESVMSIVMNGMCLVGGMTSPPFRAEVIDVPQPFATAQVRSGQWIPLSSAKDYPEIVLIFLLTLHIRAH